MSGSEDKNLSAWIEKLKGRLTGYFADSNKFALDRYLGEGVHAHAWLVRHRKQDKDPWSKMVLKTPTFAANDIYNEALIHGPESVEDFREEAKLLKTIRARHLVKLIDFGLQEDPLATQDEARNFFGNWIFLEHLEHGTLLEFVKKCDAQDIPYVPNRLLWRIFMCMIRACIAMAYIPPGDPVDRYDQNEEPCDDSKGSYTHIDMHSGNLMIGAILGDPNDIEHAISPVVKFIDLDYHYPYDGGEGEGAQKNVMGVGANMAEVVLRYEDQSLNVIDAEDEKIHVHCQLTGRAPFATFARDMLPDGDETEGDLPRPELDPDLRYLICLCCHAEPEKRPRIADQLLPWVLKAIRERDAAYYRRMPYCDGEEETDEKILLFLQKVLGAAPPKKKAEGEEEEEEDEEEEGGPESMEIDSGPGTSKAGKLKTRDARETSPRGLSTDPQSRFRQRSPVR